MKRNISVYIHWPYCISKCTYCAFNKYKIPDKGQDHERLEANLLRDLNTQLKMIKDYKIVSIYFGGGTPSLARPMLVEKIMHLLEPNANVEITLEANPSSLDCNLYDFKTAGINRLSLGIQSLDDDALITFGRDHTVSKALKSYEFASSIFDNISLDFIYSRNNQKSQDWRREIQTITRDLSPKHLSLYSLVLEKGTSLYKLYNASNTCTIDDELSAEMYEITVQECQNHGYKQYEVSSFTKDEKYQSIHNMSYWKGFDYIGVGPGAHGLLTLKSGIRIKTIQKREPEHWMTLCESNGTGIQKKTIVDTKQSLIQRIVFGMRMIQGVQLYPIDYYTGKCTDFNQKESIEDCIDFTRISRLENAGYIEYENGLLKPTQKGLQVVDSILLDILKS